MNRDYWLYLAAAIGGAAIWIVIAQASGRTEAWDSGLYFWLGMPAVCALSLGFAFFEPSRPWRWAVAPFVGQSVWMLVTQGPGNLFPAGIVVFALLCLPAFLAARLGAYVAAKRARAQ